MTRASSTHPGTLDMTRTPSALLQRKCACGGSVTTCAACADEEREKLHRKAKSNSEVNEVPPIVYDVLRSPGQPLDDQTRAFMEPRFGHDFSDVRVHTDSQADEARRQVHARAFAVGNHIAVPSDHASSNTERLRLVAHELAHVVQQSSHSQIPFEGLRVGNIQSPVELEADSVATRIVPGDPSYGQQDAVKVSSRSQMVLERVCNGTPRGQLPGEGLKPPGTCSHGKHRVLEAVAKAACEGERKCAFPSLNTVDGATSALAKIGSRTTKVVACYVAKWAVMTTCFKGGDIGHHQRIANLCRELEKCYDQLQKALRTLARHSVPSAEIVRRLVIAGVVVAVAILIAGSVSAPLATFVSALLLILGAQGALAADHKSSDFTEDDESSRDDSAPSDLIN